jgi:drug/metabolite transporter (DMT)-like permease
MLPDSRSERPVGNTSSNNIKGIIHALLATALFATAAAMAKYAVESYHVLQILFFRQLVVFLSSLPAIARTFPHSLKTTYPLLHLCRLSGAFIALSCGIWAVAVLPLTTATTLGFAQVFFVSLLAWLFLRERFGRHRWFAVIAGFTGVFIVMRPGTEGFIDIYALIPLAGALGAAVAITSVRRLSQTESTATLLVYQAVFVGVLAGVPLFWLWTTPDFKGLLLLLAMGVIAAVGQWVGVRSLRLGEASVITNIEYVKIVYATILGVFIFSEVPDAYTVTGAMVIIFSSMYLYYRESRQSV